MKRLLDIVLSLILIILTMPLMIIISIIIFFSLGRPIFFIQKRPGLYKELFNLIKFRTMRDIDANCEEDFNSDKNRLSKIGNFLRSTSLDELPELFNILFGHMSFVGPRPLLEEYLPYYSQEQSKRHNVRPGLTGWAQINGRNQISWEEKFKLDVWYVNNQTFILDLKIIIKTILKVIEREGITSKDHATMPRFDEQQRK